MNSLKKYLILRNRLDTGDLIEWRSSTAVGWLIRKFTGKKVNHSSLVVKFANEELGERRYILEALDDGIVLNLVSTRLAQFKGQAWWYPLKPEHNRLRAKILPWAIDQTGKPYDYDSLFKQMFSKVSCDARRLFCSEFYQMALSKVHLLPDGTALRPGEFERFCIHLNPVQII